MNQVRADTLKVPGANLYYEVRGSGPVLLMIPGGPADATAFAAIAPLLARATRSSPSTRVAWVVAPRRST